MKPVGGLLPVSFLDAPRPLKPRRLTVLRVLCRPLAAARLLAALAYQADMNRYAVGVTLRACADAHVPRD